MSTTFITAPQLFFTSESVTEGHPDKMCDQISDAVLDAIMEQDPMGRVACETATTTGLVMVFGEITTSASVDYHALVRRVINEIGFDHSDKGFDCQTCGVIVSIKEQSREISDGVTTALEERGSLDAADEVAAIGAGDQGMMVGFACNETPELMPLPISLAHGLTRRLSTVRRDGSLGYLRPDGKSQVTVEYRFGKPSRVDAVVISTQHAPEVSNEQLRRDLTEQVIKEIVPTSMIDDNTKIYINPSGRFTIGGPMGDAGLTGRKIIVDTYGGMARHGGGAFSGKDSTKVDRSAAYAARWVAKNVVAAGLAERCELQLSYAIGVAHPLSISVETFGTARIDDDRILALIREHFDLRPGAIIRDLNLRRPIYRQTAAYGHFGRPDLDLPWERTDRAEALRQAAGLSAVVNA